MYVLNGIWSSTGPAPSEEDVIGGISAIVWSLTLLPLLKYVGTFTFSRPIAHVRHVIRCLYVCALVHTKVGRIYSLLSQLRSDARSFFRRRWTICLVSWNLSSEILPEYTNARLVDGWEEQGYQATRVLSLASVGLGNTLPSGDSLSLFSTS